MKVLASTGGCLPTPDQFLFLKCCLSAPGRALPLWRQWREHHSLDEIDEALYRLLPLLYRSLHDSGYDGPEMPLLKGIYRRNWYCQQKLFHTLEPVLKKFNASGIPTLLLKGPALCRLFYPDPYTRYMSDTDLLVPEAHVDAAVELLQRMGWTTHVPLPLTPHYKKNFHAVLFVNADREELDLHWHLFHDCSAYEDAAPFWQRAVPLQVNAEPTLTLSPTDHMLHTCIHGYQWNPLHPLRWIIDACMIARHAGERLDWNLMIEQAWTLRLTLRLRRALELLQAEGIVALPEGVFTVLRAVPIMDFERHEHAILTNADPRLSDPKRAFLWPLRKVWYKQRRRFVHRPQVLCILTFPAMLKRELGLGDMRELPLALIKVFFKKLYYRYVNTTG